MIWKMQSILTHILCLASAPIISTSTTSSTTSSSTTKLTSKKTGSAREQRMDPVELELLRKKERERKADQRRRRSLEVKEAQNAKEAERQRGYRLKKEIDSILLSRKGHKPKQQKPRGYNMKHKSEEAKAEYNKKTAKKMRLWRAKNYGPSDNKRQNSNQPEEIKEFWSKCSEEELEKMRQKKKHDNDRAARLRKNDRRYKKANGIKRKYQRRNICSVYR